MRQKRPASGYVGTPSNTTCVTPAASGPYATYECPVTQPTSAVHQNTSSGLASNVHFMLISDHSRNPAAACCTPLGLRSEEHTSELQSLMRISYAVFCLKKKKKHQTTTS